MIGKQRCSSGSIHPSPANMLSTSCRVATNIAKVRSALQWQDSLGNTNDATVDPVSEQEIGTAAVTHHYRVTTVGIGFRHQLRLARACIGPLTQVYVNRS